MSDALSEVELPVWHHDPAARQWERGDWARPAPAPPSQLRIVTWNVWFDPFAQADRARQLLAEVAACTPEVVAFQEVTPAFLDALIHTRWVQTDYVVSDLSGATLLTGYGVVLLVRRTLPCRFQLHALPTQMGRCLLTADLELVGGRVRVATTHLESLRAGREGRRAQIEVVDEKLDGDVPAIWAGDMNIAAEWDENAWFPEAFRDVWPMLHGERPGYTIDDANEMRNALGGRKYKPVRFDRVFVRGDTWRPVSIRRLGLDALPSDMLTWPSDHYGLAATFERAEPVQT